ncbi:hypothetical protein QQ045_017456 [Rhodiola kirilowii]
MINFLHKVKKILLSPPIKIPGSVPARDAINYEFNEETGKLTVFITETCEVGYKDSSVVHFSITVTKYLKKGNLADVEGVKTKVMIWGEGDFNFC